MLSIITAIYNQAHMNKLFFRYLERYTKNKFELIVIDNGSTDGSQEFFKANGAKVIQNDGNYSYPYCQNQGIEAAQYDYLVFLNNDVLVSKDWDEKAIAVMEKHTLEIASCCATDRTETPETTYLSIKKWKYIRNPLLFLFGPGYYNLKLMHYLNYGNWEKWSQKRAQFFGDQIQEGVAGSNIIMKRSALGKIGLWDDRLQSADFDLFLRSKFRSVKSGDIKPVHLLLGIYIHHFIRLTTKSSYPPFKDKDHLIDLQEKWDIDEVNPYLEKVDMKLSKKSPYN